MARLRLCAGAGEMVLLLHWSLLNYAAVVKILKKHGEGAAAGSHTSALQLQLRGGQQSSTHTHTRTPAAL